MSTEFQESAPGARIEAHLEGRLDAQTLTVELGRALHRHGAPVDHIEATMTDVARRFGLRGQFFVAPTSLHVAFGEPGRQHAYLVREDPPGETDLGRLVAIDRLAGDVARGRVGVDPARRRLTRILDRPPRHGAATTLAAHGLVAAAAARILGGGLDEVLLGGAIGLVVGIGGRTIGTRHPAVWPATAALVAGLLAAAAAARGLTTAPWLVILAALIVLLPGLTLTLAMREVATGHLAAGAARMTGVAATFLALGCGIALADHFAASLFGVGLPGLEGRPRQPLPAGTQLAAYAACAIALVPLFGAAPRQLPSLALGCAAGLVGSELGRHVVGPALAPFAGALAIGVLGNAVARRTDRPAVLVTLPGLLLLVPGSLGVRSLSALLADDVVTGVGTAFDAAFVAAALVSGLLFANVLVAPRRGVTCPDAPRTARAPSWLSRRSSETRSSSPSATRRARS